MEIIEIAKEFAVTQQVEQLDATYYTFTEQDLLEFAQRIEQPHLQRIAELEQQIEQLREALNRAWIAFSCDDFAPGDSALVDAMRKALEETK